MIGGALGVIGKNTFIFYFSFNNLILKKKKSRNNTKGFKAN